MIQTNKIGYYKTRSIDADAVAFFKENGFFVVTGAVTQEEVQELRDETVSICRGERGELVDGQGDDSNQELADFEKLANLSDDDVIKNFLCIHYGHKFSEVLQKHLAHPVIVDVLTKIIGPNVKCMQSMLFIKSAGKPGQAWHQDEDYIPTRDRSLCGAWIAMDDATVENGCLWVIPGSHKPGVLWPMYPHNDPRFDCSVESFDFPYTDEEAIPVEVPAGSIVFFNGYLLHRSLPNSAKQGFRRALVNHYMSAESLLPWRYQEGIGLAKTDFRDIVMVAGEDPYAHKSYENITVPHVRRDGKGGCDDGRYDLATFKEEGMPSKKYL